jgi:hypothetical protein
MEVTKWLKPSMQRVTLGDPTSVQAVMRRNAEQTSKKVDVQADRVTLSGKADTAGEASRRCTQSLRRGSDDGMYQESARNTGSPSACLGD